MIRKILAFPDIHYPNHNVHCLDIIKQVTAYYKPDYLIYLGDALDMVAVNHWIEHKKLALEGQRLINEYKGFDKEVLTPINKLAGNKAKIFYFMGNHEMWVYDSYLNKHPEMVGLVEPELHLKFKEKGIKIIPFNESLHLGAWHFIHGWYINEFHSKKSIMNTGQRLVYCHCFDTETELLTKRGFLKHDEILESDEVLTMNKETELLEWNKVNKKFVYSYKGDMLHFKSDKIDLLVDEGHGMIFKKHLKGKFEYCTARELENRTKGTTVFKISGIMKQNNEFNISDNLLKIIAWTISEGSIRYIKTTPYVEINQSKENHIKEIKKLLDQSGFKYTLEEKQKSNVSKLQPYRFRINVNGSREITNILPNKNIVPTWLWKLSNRQFEIFLEEYTKGDGTTYLGKYKNQKMIYSINKPFIDYFQINMFLNGYKSLPFWKKGSFKTNKLCCQLNYQKKEYTEIRKKNISRVPYEGIKWCVNVDNGTLVVRRNGKLTITQNTHDRQVYTPSMRLGEKNTFYAQSIGCLCSKNPEYNKNKPNRWVHGFFFGLFDDTKKIFADYFIPIINNTAILPDGTVIKSKVKNVTGKDRTSKI